MNRLLSNKKQKLMVRFRAVLFSLLVGMPLGAFAQSGASLDDRVIALPDAAPANTALADANKRAILSQALKVVDQVGIILPGKGFRSVGLGDSFARVVQIWGQPQLVSKKGLAYQLDPKTVIQFLGNKKVKTINIEGLAGSFARVNNGVTFGMSPTEVRERFNQAAKPDTNKKIRYRNLGIEFEFVNAALFKVGVFAP